MMSGTPRRARPRNTAQRLVVTLTLAITAVLVITSGISIRMVDGFIQERALRRLADTSDRIHASLTGLHGLVMDPATMENMARTGPVTVVLVRDGQPVMTLNGDSDTGARAVAAAGTDGLPHDVPDRPDLIAIETRSPDLTVRTDAGPVTPTSLVVASSTAPETAARRTIAGMMAAGLLVAIMAVIALTAAVVGRGLRPLRAMAERTQRYAQGDRQTRLPVSGPDSDLTQLAATVNHAMDAQELAETRVRSFVADASHELRTPLTIASGWIELDVQGGLSDPGPRAEAMHRVQSQLGRMRILIDELALLARLDQARPLNLDAVDLNELAADVVEDARLIHPDRTFTIRATGSAALEADEARLQQVLGNLLNNAVKHTPPGTPIEVTVEPGGPDSLPGPMHTLLVTDHGPGIPVEDQEHVFERFWRGDSSRRRETGSFGLGLAIVASIVAAHGGRSDVISAPGRGTTVRIRLPARAGQASSAPGVRRMEE